MFPYADYSFYKNKAYGKMDEREFGEASIEASSILRRITFGRSDIMQPEELRYATCADVYKRQRLSRGVMAQALNLPIA